MVKYDSPIGPPTKDQATKNLTVGSPGKGIADAFNSAFGALNSELLKKKNKDNKQIFDGIKLRPYDAGEIVIREKVSPEISRLMQYGQKAYENAHEGNVKASTYSLDNVNSDVPGYQEESDTLSEERNKLKAKMETEGSSSNYFNGSGIELYEDLSDDQHIAVPEQDDRTNKEKNDLLRVLASTNSSGYMGIADSLDNEYESNVAKDPDYPSKTAKDEKKPSDRFKIGGDIKSGFHIADTAGAIDPTESFEEEYERRRNGGYNESTGQVDEPEDMMQVAENQYILTDDKNRVKSGFSVNEKGEPVAMSYLYGDADETGGAAVDSSVGRNIVDMISDGILTLTQGLTTSRQHAAEAAADYDLVNKETGYRIDESDLIDALNNNPTYWDSLKDSVENAPVTDVKPDDINDAYNMYKSGTWVVTFTDENGNKKQIPVAKFYKFDKNGNPSQKKLKFKFDEKTKQLLLNDVPVEYDMDSKGNITPKNLAAVFTEDDLTDNEDEARFYKTHDPLVIKEETVNEETGEVTDPGWKLSPKEVLSIMDGSYTRENKNDAFGLLRTSSDIDITDDTDGHISLPKFMSNFLPLAIDGALSTIPYLNPVTGIATAVNNIYQSATRGVDPFTYDVRDMTYEYPGAKSDEEQSGGTLSTSAEVLSDYFIGLGAGSKSLKNAVNSTMDKIGDREANEIKRAIKEKKKLERGYLSRIKDPIIGEGLQEQVPDIFAPFENGYDLNKYYANFKKDDNGNMMYDSAGKPILDPNTNAFDRLRNLTDALIPSGTLGGAIGGTIGAPGAIRSKRIDSARLEANGGIPYVINNVNNDDDLSVESYESLRDSYLDYLERNKK